MIKLNDIHLTDYDGNRILEGARVKMWCDWYGQFGTVTGLTDWDADFNDDAGRAVAIYPSLKVRFDDSEEITVPTSEWDFRSASYDNPPTEGMVEEVVVING